MIKLRHLAAVLLLSISACAVHYFQKAVAANNESIALYQACSEGANYAPEKPGCEPDKLMIKIEEVLPLSKKCIADDINQPQCYLLYSNNIRIYCRITQCEEKEYAESEGIARQFFEIQNTAKGSALQAARIAWVHAATAHASWQWSQDRLSLGIDRKNDLLLCYAEGNKALQESLPGPEKIRLIQNLQVLKAITDAL